MQISFFVCNSAGENATYRLWDATHLFAIVRSNLYVYDGLEGTEVTLDECNKGREFNKMLW